MSIISDNKWHGNKEEIAEMDKFISDHGYSSDDIMGVVFACWHKEFNDNSKVPKDSLVSIAKTFTEIVEIVVETKNLKLINFLYLNMTEVNHPKEMSGIFKPNLDNFCSIINNTSYRIINFNARTLKPSWSARSKVIELNINISIIAGSRTILSGIDTRDIYSELVKKNISPASIAGAIHGYWSMVLSKEHPINMSMNKSETKYVLANALTIVTQALVHGIVFDPHNALENAFIGLSKHNRCERKVIDYILETPSQMEFFRRMVTKATVHIHHNELI
jgi:hypothetical protein